MRFPLLAFLPFLFFHLAITSDVRAQKGSDQLRTAVQNKLAEQKGVFAVAFRDLKTGEVLLINEQMSYHAASTMKTPVLAEVFRQVKQKKISLDDSIVIHNNFKSIVDGSEYKLDSTDDSETELYRHLGEKRTVYQLIYQMIIVSSNLSTNMMIELVDAKNVSATMAAMGMPNLHVLRGVEDDKAYQQGLINTVTANDLMLLFEKIARGKAVSKKASEQMIKILLDQKFNDIIPAKLPAGVKVAHKTGWFTTVHHDSGIIFLPNGRKYVLVLLGKEIQDEKGATNMLAEVSEIIYKYVAQGKG
jgi:beta-lactamase class A